MNEFILCVSKKKKNECIVKSFTCLDVLVPRGQCYLHFSKELERCSSYFRAQVGIVMDDSSHPVSRIFV